MNNLFLNLSAFCVGSVGYTCFHNGFYGSLAMMIFLGFAIIAYSIILDDSW